MPPTPGAVVWFELRTADTDAARDFYGELFGWSFNPMEDYDPDYWIIDLGEGHLGGALLSASHTGDHPNDRGAVVYVEVEDLENTLEHAQRLGSSIDVGITALPDGSSFAVICDPQGDFVGIWAPRG